MIAGVWVVFSHAQKKAANSKLRGRFCVALSASCIIQAKADGSVRRFENLVAIQTPRCGDEGYEAPNVDALRKKLNNDDALNLRSMLSDAEETALLQKVKNQAAVFLKKAQTEWHRFFSTENESTQKSRKDGN